MKRILLCTCLLTACATEGASTSSNAVPRRADVWPSELSVATAGSPEQAIERARARLSAAGFSNDQAAASGQEPVGDALVVSDDRRDPGRCFGTTEVIAVKATAVSEGAALHFGCVTAAWFEPDEGGACAHTDRLGCPMGGDRAVAEMAFDALSSL